MRIGFVQNDPHFGQIQDNLDQVRELVGEQKIDLLVLPELFASGYLFRDCAELRLYAEHTGAGPVTRFLVELAKQTGGYIVGGFAELSGDHIYNAAALVNCRDVLKVYRKIHLFDREKLYFRAGEGPFWVEDLGICRLGLMICYDWYFPEAARTLALRGADLIAHPANLVLPHCPEAMKTRALENRVFTVTANRIGSDQRDFQTLSFIGRSVIYSPNGTLLASSSSDCATLQTVDITLTDARTKRVTGRNDLFADRNPEHYQI
ncbi:acyltransferase [bacterium]|nr:acyltransferase [bacterium]